MKIKLTSEYRKQSKIASDVVYDLEDGRAKELVEAGNAFYIDIPVEVKELKKKKTKIMTPRKKRKYKTK